MAAPDRTRLPLDVDTSARPIRPVEAVPGSPNVVIVLIDDMGFGASSAYGGPCEMPTAQRLADDGLRYSRFHVTSAVLADPPGADDRSQPPLRGHGGDQRDVDAGARLPRLPAGERRHDRADPQRQRLLHGGGRQVAPDPAGGGQPVGAVPAVADGRGLRLLLRLHGRGDEPLVPAALPGPLRRRAGPVARGRLPPVRGPRRQRHLLGREPAGDHPRAALLHLPRARRDARAVPRRGRVARQVRRPVRRRLGRAAGADAGPSEGARHRAGVRASWPPGPRACRTGTSSTRPSSGSPRGSWRPTPGSPSTPTCRSAGSSTPWRRWASSTTR